MIAASRLGGIHASSDLAARLAATIAVDAHRRVHVRRDSLRDQRAAGRRELLPLHAVSEEVRERRFGLGPDYPRFAADRAGRGAAAILEPRGRQPEGL